MLLLMPSAKMMLRIEDLSDDKKDREERMRDENHEKDGGW